MASIEIGLGHNRYPGWIISVEDGDRLRAIIDRKKGYFIFKRIVDVISAFVILVFILSWLLPILAVAVRLNSKGPVFFVQRRVGRGGKTFSCYKLRTMYVNDESDTRQASENDGRITAVGNFLRRTNLDELPQFLNVLMGTMSVIGPRPHMFSDCIQFSSLIPGYKFRNMVKPGITGMAQIKGYHGPTEDFESIFRRFQWDAFYVRNANFWLDFKIGRQTIMQSFSNLLQNIIRRRTDPYQFQA